MSKKGPFKSFSEELAFELAEIGIEDAFVVTGGAIAPFTSALAEQGRIRMHYMLTEQSAGVAAEAYGYFDGKPALLIVTSGPGVTNALTPVAAAWANSAPMVVVSGQARSGDVSLASTTNSRQIGNQHLRTDLLVSSIVKNFVELDIASNSKELASFLFSNSTGGRPGPVWLSIPQDIQRGPGANQTLGLALTTNSNLNNDVLFRDVIEGLKSSSKPAVLIGAGARSEISAIKNFAQKFRIPILTTWPGMDLIEENDELYCGRPGSIPSTWLPNYINVETDFLLVFGARLDLGQVGYNPGSFAANAKVVRIDIDEEEFARIPERSNWANYCLDVKEVSQILKDLASVDLDLDLSQWWEQISDWKKLYPKPRAIPQVFEDGVSSYQLISHISNYFKEKNIVTGSSGTCMEMLLQSWEVQEGQRIINSCGIGSMGFALPAAIGVSVKTGDGEVICIESDGSFAMNLQDLVTMKYMRSIFKIIVMDSSGYKSISLSQGRLKQFAHGNSQKTDLGLPEIESIAESIGFETKTIQNDHEIAAAIEWLSAQKVSSLLVVKVSPSEDALPRLISRPNSDGVMETPPMNELSPIF